MVPHVVSTSPWWSAPVTSATGSLHLVQVNALQPGAQVLEIWPIRGKVLPAGQHDVIEDVWAFGRSRHPVSIEHLAVDF